MCKTEKRALALGYFDGLHLAHLAVLQAALRERENGLRPAVMLFDKHPLEVLRGVEVPRLLTGEDRDAMLENMGFELIRVRFAELQGLLPETFVEEILCSQLGCAFVSCGYNYRFGKNGAGNAEVLCQLCSARGVDVSVSKRIRHNGRQVSSSVIRAAIEAGEMQTAVSLLGRPFSFAVPVIPGEHRGHSLGAPTVNQYLPKELITPRLGVYASVAEIDGKTYAAVTNIGSRPTFGGENVRSETYIHGFSGDLYGRTVRIGLIAFIRDERKFPSAEALKTQIAHDAAEALAIAGNSEFFEK